MTWEYRGLQGVAEGYKGLQGVTGVKKGVTRGDSGRQGVTRSYRGVTKDYRNFFPTRTFPNTFSCSILHKIQS